MAELVLRDRVDPRDPLDRLGLLGPQGQQTVKLIVWLHVCLTVLEAIL